jgi:subtilase family serine protease
VKRSIKLGALCAVALALAACSGAGSNPPAFGQSPMTPSRSAPAWQTNHLAKPACTAKRSGEAICFALVQSSHGIGPTVAGWGPTDFQTRYNLPSSTHGSGQIVAIVDAYDNPNVATDLAAYRSNFGLGTASFFKYNQEGQQSNYPSGSQGWGTEIDLDVEMVSAVCPNCTIYLLEANSSNSSDLDASEAEAVKLGAHITSNSWGCYQSNSCDNPADFDTPGVMYVAASGDAGYNENGNPESLPSVTAVGGTVLSKSGSTYNEVVWDGAGGGCSNNGSGTGEAKPAWQHDPSCAYRTDTDLAAVAWGVAEYDTYGYHGWITIGGTSVASPMVAGIYGLAGNAASQNAGQKFWKLKQKKRNHDLHYISSGSDGSCGGSYLCTAGTGEYKTYAGPIGWGTPNGLGAF